MENKVEPINISVFGPADHGKSTLIGYLFAMHTDGFSVDEYVRRWRSNDWFAEDRKYAYLLDILPEERTGRIESKAGIGTSRRLHYVEIKIGDSWFLFIDNPGHKSLSRTYSKGIFQGEYGIFAIAANELRKYIPMMKQHMQDARDDVGIPVVLADFFVPLRIAVNFGMKTNIVVITKMDLVDHSQEVFAECKATMAEFLQSQFAISPHSYQTIPVSIAVAEGRSDNITSRPQYMTWWTGPTLKEAIGRLQHPCSQTSLPLCLVVDKAVFDVPGHPALLRGKVVSGTLRRSDAVKVAPLKAEELPRVAVSATIRSIQMPSESARPDTPHRLARQKQWNKFSERVEFEPGSVVSVSLSEGEGHEYLGKEHLDSFGAYRIITRQTDAIQHGTVVCIEIASESNIPRPNYGEQCTFYLNGKELPNGRFVGILSGLDRTYTQAHARYLCVAFLFPLAAVMHDDKPVGCQAILGYKGMLYPGQVRCFGEIERHSFAILPRSGTTFDKACASAFKPFVDKGFISMDRLESNELLTLEFNSHEHSMMKRPLERLLRMLTDIKVTVVPYVTFQQHNSQASGSRRIG